MPSKSIAQQHLMQAAEHGADFPMADKLRQSMTHNQLHDFAIGSEAGKPQHVAPSAPPTLIKGEAPSVVSSNTNSLRQGGLSELDATRQAIQTAQAFKPATPRHKNLGKYLHPRKDGKAHGSE